MSEPISEVYLMDCIEGMKRYADKYFDLAIVDPPYNIGGDSLHSNRKLKGAGKLKNRAINKFNTKWDDIAPTAEYFNELKRVSKNWIIWGGNYFELGKIRCFIAWDKCQPWENFSQVELAYTSFDKPSSLFKFDNRTTDKIHPTQKPVDLYKWILHKYAKEGDKILDTHMGSQSSRIAAHKAKLDYVGFEIDKEYFDAGNKRFNDYKLQLRLF
jgi:site-specific DNA-methyltransferase (adenine-specific)